MPIVDAGVEPPIGNVVVQDVRDLELAAPGWSQALDHVKDIRSQEVHANRNEVALGMLRFFLEPDNLPRRIQLGDPEPVRIRYPMKERARPPSSRFELARNPVELWPPQDVVAQDTAERVVAHEIPGEADGVGDTQSAALIAIRQIEAEVRAVGQQLDDVADALPADDDEHLLDAHPGQGLDRVVDHRPVVDRQEMLVGHDRERVEPGRRPPGKHDPLHEPRPFMAPQRNSR